MRKSFLQQQAITVLSQPKYALFLTAMLSVLPYMDWLAMSLIALVTLRHGARAGMHLVIPALCAQFVLASFSLPIGSAMLLVFANVVPCYLAAYALKLSTSWRVVSGIFLGMVAVGVITIHTFLPELISEQYVHLEVMLQNITANNSMNLIDFWQGKGVSPALLENYLLGVQAASMVFSSVMSLLLARSIQSQLFYPGGFRSEMMHFRGDKVSLMIGLLLLTFSYYGYFFAINCLPFVLLYFILAGLSLAAYLFSGFRPILSVLMMVVPMILLSWIVLPLYALLGALDSVFNLRLYLSTKTGKAI